MKITVPQTSTRLIDILTETEGALALIEEKNIDKYEAAVYIEAKGGTIYYTTFNTPAVIEGCASIPDGNAVQIKINEVNRIDHIKMIAGAGVTAIIEITNY